MEIQIKSYLNENNVGDLSYKIEIDYLNCFTCWNFILTIEIDYNDYPAIRKAIIDLACQELTLETKLEAIRLILSLVNTIEVTNDCNILEIFEDEEFNVEFILPKFLISIALQFSLEQLAPLSIFNKKIHLRKFINGIEPYLN